MKILQVKELFYTEYIKNRRLNRQIFWCIFSMINQFNKATLNYFNIIEVPLHFEIRINLQKEPNRQIADSSPTHSEQHISYKSNCYDQKNYEKVQHYSY